MRSVLKSTRADLAALVHLAHRKGYRLLCRLREPFVQRLILLVLSTLLSCALGCALLRANAAVPFPSQAVLSAREVICGVGRDFPTSSMIDTTGIHVLKKLGTRCRTQEKGENNL